MSMPTTATAIPALAALAAGAFGGHGPDATSIPRARGENARHVLPA